MLATNEMSLVTHLMSNWLTLLLFSLLFVTQQCQTTTFSTYTQMSLLWFKQRAYQLYEINTLFNQQMKSQLGIQTTVQNYPYIQQSLCKLVLFCYSLFVTIVSTLKRKKQFFVIIPLSRIHTSKVGTNGHIISVGLLQRQKFLYEHTIIKQVWVI